MRNFIVHRFHSEEMDSSCSVMDKIMISTREGTVESKTERFHCTECGMSYISLQKYLDHVNKHTGAKPYVCRECNKQFVTLPYLKNHQKLHSAERQFVCEVCGKAFKLKNNLQMHELTHSKEKPFKCDECDKSYTHPSNLKIHKQEHSGVKPFQCEQVCYNILDSFTLNKFLLFRTVWKMFPND